MKMLRQALLVAASTTVMAAPVSAGAPLPFGDWTWLFNGCGGNEYSTCMSGSIYYDYSASSVTVSVTNIANASDGGDIFTAVGLFNLPAANIGTGCPTVPAGGWTCDHNGINGGGLGDNTLKYAAGVSGINGGFPTAINPNASQSFVFTFNTSLAAYANTIGVGIHAQGGPRGCSTKMGVTSSGVVQNQGQQLEYNCGASVPEPSSLLLLGTGAAGLAFIRSRRRRIDLVDEDGNDVDI